jgi:hypothetical protein
MSQDTVLWGGGLVHAVVVVVVVVVVAAGTDEGCRVGRATRSFPGVGPASTASRYPCTEILVRYCASYSIHSIDGSVGATSCVSPVEEIAH